MTFVADRAPAPAPPPLDSPGAGRLAHVAALDGARGIAVLLVLGYHFAVPGLRGGFLGVDLFFVLSGFLITSLLLAEQTAAGSISLVTFWLRRARRLLPAVFVLLGVVALYALTVDPLEKTALRGDLLSSIFYVTNWHFIIEGQSYFAETVGATPLRHLWSLAIEEQFYVLWPLAVGLCLALVGRKGLIGRSVVLAGWAVATVVSVALTAILYDPVDPSRAYFGTDARAHELLIGASLAVLLARRTGAEPRTRGARRARPKWSGAQALAGLLGALAIAVFAVTLTDQGSAYYHGGSLLFSLAAAGLIAGTLGPRTPLTRALSWRPLVWVGSVSYGMYLWHWPMAVWLTPESTGLDGVLLFVVRSLTTLGATALSFYLVERPVRRGRIAGRRLGPAIVFPAALAIAVALAGLSYATTRGQATAVEQKILDDGDWSLQNELAGADAPTVAIIGDSVARSLWSGVATTAKDRQWSAWRSAFGSCEVGDLLNVDRSHAKFKTSDDCVAKVPARQAEMVKRADPAVILWYSGRDRYDVRVDGKLLSAGSEAWLTSKRADWDRTLERLTKRGAKVVLVLPVVPGSMEPQCDRGLIQGRGCGSHGYLTTSALRGFYRDWAKGHTGNVQVVDPMPVICPPGMPCPEKVDGVQLRFDHIHYTPEGADLIAPRIFDLSSWIKGL